MKKIPTLFTRKFEGHKVVGITSEVYPGMEWVLEGEGLATLKLDGSCTAIINGELYKRYDARNGKKAPEGAIPCCDPDPVTGHWPHWVLVDPGNPADKWYMEAFNNAFLYAIENWEGEGPLPDGTYEAVGPHFQGNPYRFDYDTLIKHGEIILNVPRTFEGIRQYLAGHVMEGIVFWKDGEPQCKIKSKDFGLEWPVKIEP